MELRQRLNQLCLTHTDITQIFRRLYELQYWISFSKSYQKQGKALMSLDLLQIPPSVLKFYHFG